jgi:hypothetical protein
VSEDAIAIFAGLNEEEDSRAGKDEDGKRLEIRKD